MREIIVLQIGQAGIQIGNSCWQLFCLQHNISPNGKIKSQNLKQNNSETYYSQTSAGKYIPRSVFIDLQPTVIDQIKTSTYRDLYHPENLISGKEDSANNFIRGHYTIGKQILDNVLDRIRKQTEKCTNFQGFLKFSALGGGTGSGLGSLILQRLSIQYNKKSRIGFNIFPSPQMYTSCVQPYNAVLAAHEMIQLQDISVVIDNEALYNICSRKLNIDQPNYRNINRLIAQVVSSLTYSSRFNGSLNVSLNDFQTNLVPYPRINFIQSSYSPFVSSQKQYLDKYSTTQLTNLAFDPQNMMVGCNPRQGKYMACCLNYRGDIVPSEVLSAVNSIKQKKTINFVDWCPTGFKVGINNDSPLVVPQGELAKTINSCSMISNSTSIVSVFAKINHKYDLMYAKRAFVHWYVGEGLSQGFFQEARQNLAALQKDYEQVAVQSQ